MLGYITVMVDLENQDQTIFVNLYYFKVIHLSYIIYFKLFEFPHHDYVDINTKIKVIWSNWSVNNIIFCFHFHLKNKHVNLYEHRSLGA